MERREQYPDLGFGEEGKWRDREQQKDREMRMDQDLVLGFRVDKLVER